MKKIQHYKTEFAFFTLMTIIYVFLIWLVVGMTRIVVIIGFPLIITYLFNSTFRPVFTGLKNNKFHLMVYESSSRGGYNTSFKSYPMGRLTKRQMDELEVIADEIRNITNKSEAYYISFVQNDVMYFLDFLSNASQNRQFMNIDTHIEETKLFLQSAEGLVEQYLEEEKKRVSEFGQSIAERAVEAHNEYQRMIMQKHKDFSINKDK